MFRDLKDFVDKGELDTLATWTDEAPMWMSRRWHKSEMLFLNSLANTNVF